MLAGPKGESFVSEARITHQETGMVPGVSVGNSDHRGGTAMIRNHPGKTSETLPGQNTLAKDNHKPGEKGRK